MSTYLPYEGYRNYGMSNHSVLNTWLARYFTSQPLTFSLFIVNQPRTVKSHQYRFSFLPMFLGSPYQFLFCFPWRKPSITNCRWAVLGIAWTAKCKNWMMQKERPYKYCRVPAFLKCSLFPDCSIRAYIHKARHPEIDGNLSVDCTVCVLSLQVLEVNPRCYKELLKLHLNWK